MISLDRYLALACLLIFGAGFYIAAGYPTAAGIGPMFTCGAGFALALLQFFKGPSVSIGLAKLRCEFRPFGVFLLALVLVVTLGFQIGGPIFAFGYGMLILRLSIIHSIAFALPAALIFGPLIERTTGQVLFEGLLLEVLR